MRGTLDFLLVVLDRLNHFRMCPTHGGQRRGSCRLCLQRWLEFSFFSLFFLTDLFRIEVTESGQKVGSRLTLRQCPYDRFLNATVRQYEAVSDRRNL
jgi:hypothetical protein